jgi:Tfp pilus assembly protein FimT
MTLLEIIIVIAILLVVLTIALPNFNKYIHNSNLKSAGRDLEEDIINSKQATVTQQTTVGQIVCYKIWLSQSNNNYGIVQGVGADCNSAVYDYTHQTIKTPSSFATYIKIDSTNYPKGAYNNSPEIQFQPRGTTSTANAAATADGLDPWVRLTNDRGSTVTIKTNLMGKVSFAYALQ